MASREVNDSLGHHSGDLVLQEVAARLKGAVPEESLVARLGGDEFAILCRTHGAEDDVTVIAQLILTSIGSTMTIHGTDVTVGVSLGAAIAPNHRTDGSSLLKQADAAMYAAKRQGGGVRVYDPLLEAPMRDAYIVAPRESR